MKFFFHDNEETDACEALLHYQKFYGADCKLYSIKFDSETDTMKLTQLRVERKKYVYSHSGQ